MSFHNRLMNSSLSQAGATEASGAWVMPTSMVGFMQCPSALLADWSEARIEELRQLYRRAYELAQEMNTLTPMRQSPFSFPGRN